MRIAQIKTYPVKGDLDHNHRLLQELLAQIAPHQPDVVITPEGWLDGYVSTEETVTRDNIADYGVNPADSHYVNSVADWAAAAGAWVIFGCIRRAPEGAYNTALILDRDGALVGMYDKTHIQTHDHKYQPGRALPVFRGDIGPFGVMICADRRWPETVRTLALRGAGIILNPTYGMHDERNLWMMRIRSYESEIPIAFTHPGQSLITDAAGEIVVNVTDPDRPYVITDVDLSGTDAVRAQRRHLLDRRPDLYA